MEINQKTKVSFLLRKNRTKGSEQTIYIRIAVDSRRAEFSSKHQVLPKEWDKKRGRVKSSNPQAVSINNYLERAKAKLTDIVFKANRIDEKVTAEEVKQLFLGKDPQSLSKEKTLLYAFECHNKQMKKEV